MHVGMGPTLEVTTDGDIAVARLLGEHDLASAAEVRESVTALGADRAGVVVDVSETEFVDVAVLRALLDAEAELKARGGRLVLALGTACVVERLLELTNVPLPCASTIDQAVEVARGGAS
jgi:anti-anti-sigma factor